MFIQDDPFLTLSETLISEAHLWQIEIELSLCTGRNVSATLLFALLTIIIIENIAVVDAETLGATLKPIEDGYVDSLQPTVNFAGSNLDVEYFYIRPQNRQRWAFLLFDLADVPSNATIQSAELYIYALEVHGNLRVGAFRGYDTSWNEKDLYWTLARKLSIDQTSNNSQVVTNVAWYHFDLRKDVQDSLSTGKLTVVLKADYPQEYEYAASVVFSSNDQPGRFNIPRLEIVYSTSSTELIKQPTPIDAGAYQSYLGVLVTVIVTAAGVLLWKAKGTKREPVPQPEFRGRDMLTEGSLRSEPKAQEQVPEMLQRISTGHKGLDRLLWGGIKKTFAIVLTSPSCDEVDHFVHRFIETGLEADNAVLYVTAKMGAELELAYKYLSFHYVICNTQASPEKLRMPNVYLTKGLESLTEINLVVAGALEVMDRTRKQKMACVDLASDVLLQHGPAAARHWLLDFISRMKSQSVTMLATLNSQMHSREELESLLDLFDGQIDLWDEKTEGRSLKYIKIKRMYRERYSDESIPITR